MEELEALSSLTELSAAVAQLADQLDYSASIAELSAATAALGERLQAVEASLAAHSTPPEAVSGQVEAASGDLQADFSGLSTQIQQLSAMLEQLEPGEREVIIPVFSSGRLVEHVEGGVRLRLLRGDTIWDLARRFENPPSRGFINAIMDANEIADPRKLQIGQVIFIPVP
jgi:nucleoid-associated protein YgaU